MNSLREIPDALGVEALVFPGVATDMAVLAAVFQTSNMLYNAIAPADCCTSVNPKFRDGAIEMIDAMALFTIAGET